MLNFVSSPLLIINDKNLPPLESILDSLYNDLEIPIRVITNVNDSVFQQLNIPNPNLNIAYIIITIKYLQKFEA